MEWFVLFSCTVYILVLHLFVYKKIWLFSSGVVCIVQLYSGHACFTSVTQNITAQKSAKLHGYCPTSFFLNSGLSGVVCIANGE